ncbi:MAG: fibronectin type III domain-containing protein [Desulfobulbaceae bacterium]|nr:fibronectin type III domain-containing protein [Desulfobulbaceae bacterium]
MKRKRVLSVSISICFLLFCIHLLNAANLVPVYHLLLGKKPWFAPANLSAVALSGGAIRLTWQDRSQGETVFEIEGKHAAGNDFEYIMSVEGNKSMCTVSALTGYYLAPSTEYQFRVRAAVNSRVTEYSNVASATTLEEPTIAPAAPSNLQAGALSAYAITTSWTDNADNEYSFSLEQSMGCTDPYAWVADIVADSTSYTVDALSPNQQYCYRLRAENPAGESAWSNEAEATTPIDANIPSAPTSLTVSSCRTTIFLTQYCFSLSWQDNADNEERFILYSMNTLNFPRTWNLVSPTAPVQDAEQYSICSTSLRPSFSIFRLAAVNSYGQSPFVYASSSEYTGDCPGPIVPTVPAAPTGVSATALSENTISLSWTDVSDNENGYKIRRSLLSDSGFVVIASLNADTESFEDSGLAASTTYYYKVQAWNSQGFGESEVVSATTESGLTAPAGPTGLQVDTVERTSSSLALSWTDNSDNETYFQILRSLSPSSGFTQVDIVEANATSYTDNGLTPCTQYYYRVYSWNSQGSSSQYAGNSGTTLPAPPQNLTASQGTVLHAVYLDWDHESCAAGYNLYEMYNQFDGWQPVNHSGPLTDNYYNIFDVGVGSALEPGIALFYRLSSENGDEAEGSAGDHVVGWAGSPVPQEVAASRGLYPDKITLEWKPVQACPDGNLTTASYLREYDISWSDTPGGGGSGWVKFKTASLPGTPYADGTVSSAPEKFSVDIREATQFFPGVSPGSTYYFVVTGVYMDDNNCDHIPDNATVWESQPSQEAAGWAQQQAPAYLPAPAWITASDGTSTTKIDVSWASVAGAANYKVYRAQSSFGPWTHIRTLAATSFSNTTSDSSFNIIPGTGYFYYVIPVDGNGTLGYPSSYDDGFAITDVMTRW